jgi:ribonuclease HII
MTHALGVRPTLAELRDLYVHQGRPVPEDVYRSLREDPRRGAQALLKRLHRVQALQDQQRARLDTLLAPDRELWRDGHRFAGVDEAGMSPWAGPIVAAAVILPPEPDLPGVDDSKTLSEEHREALAERIKHIAVAWAVGTASPDDILRFNSYHAGRLAMRRAVLALRPRPTALVVDAREVPGFRGPQRPMVKADQKCLSVAAASVIAKTTRDRFLRRLDAMFPGYGFARNKGYGVPEHAAGLRSLGPCLHHRPSFDVVRQLRMELDKPSPDPQAGRP